MGIFNGIFVNSKKRRVCISYDNVILTHKSKCHYHIIIIYILLHQLECQVFNRCSSFLVVQHLADFKY